MARAMADLQFIDADELTRRVPFAAAITAMQQTLRGPFDPEDDVPRVVVDVPSGRVHARVRREAGRTTAVTFRNVESRVLARGLAVTTTAGVVSADLVYGGAVYATLPAAAVGPSIRPEPLTDLIRLGHEITWALNEHPTAQLAHARLSGVYGTIFVDALGRNDSIIDTRFTARVAEHAATGVIPEATGMAYRLGTSTFETDQDDPLSDAFSLR